MLDIINADRIFLVTFIALIRNSHDQFKAANSPYRTVTFLSITRIMCPFYQKNNETRKSASEIR